jgi:hypothetical protein
LQDWSTEKPHRKPQARFLGLDPCRDTPSRKALEIARVFL